MASGYFVGDFDMFNVGHLDLLSQARSRCEHLTVGVLSDEDIVLVTGRSPVIPQVERLAIVGGVRGVDHAVLHDEHRSRSGVTVFVSDDFLSVPDPDVVLRRRRSTASAMLLASLAPASQVSAA